MEDCTRVQSFDYFSGSEAAYIVTVIFVLGSVIRKSVFLGLCRLRVLLFEYSVEFLIEYLSTRLIPEVVISYRVVQKKRMVLCSSL